ncbi:hypothetical protein ABPG72_002926 [Tetrahymena utriculariae]
MGQQSTKISTQEKSKWVQLKQRKITELEEQALSQRINFPFESIQKAVNFLEQKKYIVENGFLGMGGSALVMKACSEENDYLAIKFFINPSQTQVKACQQEFQILNQFNSPHIIKVYDIIQEQYESMNYQILIMERCAYDLKSYLQKSIKNKKIIPNNQIYRLCLELAKGLRDLHSKNILHLDIKPGNILFGIDLKWKFADLGVSKFLDNKDQTEHLEGYTAQYSSPEQYQLANCHSKKSITKSSDIYSLGLVFIQLTGVDISQKWIFSEKLNGGNYDKCLNPNFEQFNTIIKQMVCYEPEDRLEINGVVNKIKKIIKDEYDSNQSQQKVLVLKKVQSNNILQKKEDSREQTPISLSRQNSNINILQNSVAEQSEQEEYPKSKTKKLKIIRRPSLKLFQNNIIQQGLNQQRNESSISPTVFKQTFNSQKSGDNTPKLPQIKQNPASFNVSGYFNQVQTPKQIVQNKYTNIKLGFSNVLAQSSYNSGFKGQNLNSPLNVQSSYNSGFKEQNLNSPLNIYHSSKNSQNSQQFQNNSRQKTPSQFFNFNHGGIDLFQKQQQELLSPQYKIHQRKIDSIQAVKDFILPKLKYEDNNVHNNIYQEYAIKQNHHRIQKSNGNMLSNSHYFGQNQKQQNHNLSQNQEDRNNQKRRSSSLITFQ